MSATKQSLLHLSRTDSLLSGSRNNKGVTSQKSRSRSAKHEESRGQDGGFA